MSLVLGQVPDNTQAQEQWLAKAGNLLTILKSELSNLSVKSVNSNHDIE